MERPSATLDRGDGPFIMASATDISIGTRVTFSQNTFNAMCSDLGPVRLSRAAAASSAVPAVLSPVTINNYGGTCGYAAPPWVRLFTDSSDPPRPASRAIRDLKDLTLYYDSVKRPYIHLVDGGVSDNLGMRGVLDAMALLEALHDAGMPTRLDKVRRIIVFVVNSQSSPPTDWDASESPPGTVDVLLQAAGVPIDHYSYEAVELLKDISARWQTARRIRELAGCSANKDSPVCKSVSVQDAKIFAIDVSFAALPDGAERNFLNAQPTSFVLPAEAVDRLRSAAGTIVLASPEFQGLLNDIGAKVIPAPAAGAGSAPGVR